MAARVCKPQSEWADLALCAQTDPELFYPRAGETALPAKAICDCCPVSAECLDWAIAHRENFGIWGGLQPRQRRLLALQLGLTADDYDDAMEESA